jgi:hypothetical protein
MRAANVMNSEDSILELSVMSYELLPVGYLLKSSFYVQNRIEIGTNGQ